MLTFFFSSSTESHNKVLTFYLFSPDFIRFFSSLAHSNSELKKSFVFVRSFCGRHCLVYYNAFWLSVHSFITLTILFFVIHLLYAHFPFALEKSLAHAPYSLNEQPLNITTFMQIIFCCLSIVFLALTHTNFMHILHLYHVEFVFRVYVCLFVCIVFDSEIVSSKRSDDYFTLPCLKNIQIQEDTIINKRE